MSQAVAVGRETSHAARLAASRRTDKQRRRWTRAYVAFATFAVFVGPYLFWIAWITSDTQLRQHLKLTLGAEREASFPWEVRFALNCSAEGGTVVFHRHAVLRANGGAIQTLVVGGRVDPGGPNVHYWRRSPLDAERWLGPPGVYEIVATVGPVASPPIRIAVPFEILDSPSVAEVTATGAW